MDSLTDLEIAQMIDLSAVRAEDTEANIRRLVASARKYHCYLVTMLPCHIPLAKELLQTSSQGESTLVLGGNVGFPSGGQTTRVKIVETRELIQLGCNEIDMVINIGWLLSDREGDVLHDILDVVSVAREIAPATLIKVILECHYLTQDQIRRACDLCIRAGADFVKTGTGWAPTGATLENIACIKAHVGDAIRIKASGGIRTREALIAMHHLGAVRFGIGMRWIDAILGDEKAQNS